MQKFCQNALFRKQVNLKNCLAVPIIPIHNVYHTLFKKNEINSEVNFPEVVITKVFVGTAGLELHHAPPTNFQVSEKIQRLANCLLKIWTSR